VFGIWKIPIGIAVTEINELSMRRMHFDKKVKVIDDFIDDFIDD
jgi:hypothetical protein